MKLFRSTGDTTAEDETAPGEKGDTAMSQYPTQQDAGTDQPQPTFTPAGTASAQETSLANDAPIRDETPAADEPAAASPAAPASPYVPAAASPAAPASPAQEPAATVNADESPAPLPVDEPAAVFMADEPLLSNTTGMRASWQKVQAAFVDDPQEAVMDAAGLIEQTAQSLVEALQQRRRQLRLLSDGGAADAGATAGSGTGSAASGGAPDTEHLRLTMQRYRTLFDQLCNA